MPERLLLGEGALLGVLLGRAESAHVVTGEEATAERAREAGLVATAADPADTAVLADLPTPSGVLVVAETAARALEVVRAVRAAGLETAVVASARTDPEKRWGALSAAADRVVDPERAVVSAVLDRLGQSGQRVARLRRVLEGVDRLAVVTHDNPDPDAIASAVALTRVAAAAGCEAGVHYYGDITHQENRAFVNLLAFDLAGLDPGETPEADGLALIDHSRPGVNDGLPADADVDVVIDHHPPRGPVEARYVDIRSSVGATSTLLAEYLDGFGVDLATDTATGLLFGIRTDTREFTREVSTADFEAAAHLLPAADLGTLERIESPNISADTFETIAAAIANRRHERGILFSGVGRLADRDALAQAADRLVQLEDVSTVVVYGIADGRVFVSARCRDPEMDVGELLREAFGQIGSAGGHADMAGAQLTLGVLESIEEGDESLSEVVGAVIRGQVVEALGVSPQPRGDLSFGPADAGDTGVALADELFALETGETGANATDDDPSAGAGSRPESEN